MKLLLSLLIFIQSEQILLFDTNDNLAGSVSVTGDTMYIKINGYPVEVFYVSSTLNRHDADYYRVLNPRAEGWVIVRHMTVMIELLVDKKYYFNDTYYRPYNK